MNAAGPRGGAFGTNCSLLHHPEEQSSMTTVWIDKSMQKRQGGQQQGQKSWKMSLLDSEEQGDLDYSYLARNKPSLPQNQLGGNRYSISNLYDRNKRSSSFTLGSRQQEVSPQPNSLNPGKSQKMLKKMLQKLEVESEEEAYQKIKDFKSQEQFVICVVELVKNCTPSGYILNETEGPKSQKAPSQQVSEQPGLDKVSLKQCWKFLRTLMEKYLKMKKSQVKYEAQADIIQGVQSYLRCQESEEIIPKIVNLLFERDIFLKIYEKIKVILKLEWVKSPHELERAIEL